MRKPLIILLAFLSAPIVAQQSSTDWDPASSPDSGWVVTPVSDWFNESEGTFAIWVAMDTEARTEYLLRLQNGSSGEISIAWNDAASHVSFLYTQGAGIFGVDTSTQVSQDGAWHHYVISWSIAAGEVRYFLDGELLETDSGFTVPFTAPNTVNRFMHVGGGNFFDGRAAHLQWWNRYLGSDEVPNLYRCVDATTRSLVNWIWLTLPFPRQDRSDNAGTDRSVFINNTTASTDAPRVNFCATAGAQ